MTLKEHGGDFFHCDLTTSLVRENCSKPGAHLGKPLLTTRHLPAEFLALAETVFIIRRSAGGRHSLWLAPRHTRTPAKHRTIKMLIEDLEFAVSRERS